jgi:DEAD/DEAH box helicase domain-containing protein
VVIDEAHIYRGVFGSHVACVIRRLRRLCALYGSNPQFILCTATVANPGEHAAG